MTLIGPTRIRVAVLNEKTGGSFELDLRAPDEESKKFLLEAAELLERWLQVQKIALETTA